MVDVPANDAAHVEEQQMSLLISIVEQSGQFDSNERAIFWMRFIDNESYDKIGRAVGASRETVRQMYKNSMQRVKELMADE